jgi:hypothetical protein
MTLVLAHFRIKLPDSLLVGGSRLLQVLACILDTISQTFVFTLTEALPLQVFKLFYLMLLKLMLYLSGDMFNFIVW